MKKLSLFLTLTLIAGCAAPANVESSDAALSGQQTSTGLRPVASRPVFVGRNENRRANACTRRVQPRSETASVYWAPEASGPVKARISEEVLACDAQGDWTGIVFAGPGETVDYCALNRRIARPTEYQGPCRSGWVRSRDLAG
jgi:hypothetical protein